MSTTRFHVPTPYTTAPTRGKRDPEQALHLGTFADGQRGAPLTVSYSAEVGSFGATERK